MAQGRIAGGELEVKEEPPSRHLGLAPSTPQAEAEARAALAEEAFRLRANGFKPNAHWLRRVKKRWGISVRSTKFLDQGSVQPACAGHIWRAPCAR